MERVNLTKYGFTRSEADDFSDDGNKFYCYKVGRVIVSKCTGCGIYFIDGRINGNLEYEEYSKLPHYKAIGRLNGIAKNELTEDDLAILFSDCLEYNTEYTKAENQIVWPTLEQIAAKRKQLREIRIKEFEEISKLATVEKVMSLKSYEATSFKDSYDTLKRNAYPTGTDEEYAKNVYKTAYSRSFVKNDYELLPSYSYQNLKKYLQA